jgi:Uma2 family endonuclease
VALVELVEALLCLFSSPPTRHYDLRVKREECAAHGVGEFWFVDPDEQAVFVYSDGASEPTRYERGGTVLTDLLPGLTVLIDEVLAA